MNLVPISSIPESLPDALRPLVLSCSLFDSSCGSQARVYYLDAEGGLFLKIAQRDSLREEAELTRYFHQKGLAPEILLYESGSMDYLLTRKLPGRDCVHPDHLSQPERLCDALGQALRLLHSTPAADCPVTRTPSMLHRAEERFRAGHFDASLPPAFLRLTSAEETRAVLTEFGPQLRADTLIHADYCLPNVILDNWKLAGFIDVGGGGLGDRHTDLFWGIWSLQYNLKTDRYTDRFLDAYGRDGFEPELLRAAAALEAFG